MNIYIYIYTYIYIYIYPSFFKSIYLSIYVDSYLSIYLSITPCFFSLSSCFLSPNNFLYLSFILFHELLHFEFSFYLLFTSNFFCLEFPLLILSSFLSDLINTSDYHTKSISLT